VSHQQDGYTIAAEPPILPCSPTMNWGTFPAECGQHAHRSPPRPIMPSAAAGRSGLWLVFTYCTTGSPHDQYYFACSWSPTNTPPRIADNEDLIRSHVQAIWLAESGLSLGKSLKDLLDLSGDDPRLACLDFVQDALNAQGNRAKAKLKAQAALSDIESDLKASDWWNEAWLDSVLAKIDLEFNQACERWRDLTGPPSSSRKCSMPSSTMPAAPPRTGSRPSACARRRKASSSF
jgi:hypothetical protein